MLVKKKIVMHIIRHPHIVNAKNQFMNNLGVKELPLLHNNGLKDT